MFLPSAFSPDNFVFFQSRNVILDAFFSNAKQLGDTGNGYAGISLHKFNNLSPSLSPNFIAWLFPRAFFRKKEWMQGEGEDYFLSGFLSDELEELSVSGESGG